MQTDSPTITPRPNHTSRYRVYLQLFDGDPPPNIRLKPTNSGAIQLHDYSLSVCRPSNSIPEFPVKLQCSINSSDASEQLLKHVLICPRIGGACLELSRLSY